MRTLAAVGSAVALWACSSDPVTTRCSADSQCGTGRVCDTGTCKAASVRSIGEACTTDAACSVGSICAAAMPGGLCTYTCAGDACPTGAVCTDLRASGSGIVCSKACTSSADCRSGYTCCPGFGACVPAASCPAQSRPASADLGNACPPAGCAAGEICGSGPEFPGGACTSACNPADQSTCPSGSSCVSTSTGSFCFASCSAACANAQLTCAGGLCRAPGAPPACAPSGAAPTPVQGGVAGPTKDPGCTDSQATAPQASALPTVSKGTNLVGTEISITVPPGTGSMSIYSQGVNVPITSVKLSSTIDIPNSVVPTLVKDPSGAQIFDDLPAPPPDASGLPIFYAGFSPFTGTMTLPNTSFFLEHTSMQGGITPGTWKFTVNDFAQECTQVTNCSGGGATDSYDVQAYFKPGIAPATGTVDFAFYFVGGPVTYTAAPNSAAFAKMLGSLAQILAKAGLCIGKVTLYDVPDWVKQSTVLSGSIDADNQKPCGPLSRLLMLSAPGNQVNIFLVTGFQNASGSPINTVGVDGTIPGPSGVGGTPSSGAAANGSDLVVTASCGTGVSPRTCGPDAVAYIVAHEAGHFMGLYHTTERTGDQFDPVADTKKCECTSCAPTLASKGTCAANRPPTTPTDMLDSYCVSGASVPQCGGGDNLMFWLLGDHSAAAVSPQQGQVMRANPVVR